MTRSKKLVFFIDRSLGSGDVPAALSEAGATVVVHDDRFPQDAQDVDWILDVVSQGWVILTKDKRISTRALERLAIAKTGAKVFVLTSANISGPSMGSAFVRALNSMRRFEQKYQGPFIAKVSKNGRVYLYMGRTELTAWARGYGT